MTDTGGLLAGAEVHPADVQDRDGAGACHRRHPPVVSLAESSLCRKRLSRPHLRDPLVKFGEWTIEIVKRAADATGFQLLPRRWVVERTLA